MCRVGIKLLSFACESTAMRKYHRGFFSGDTRAAFIVSGDMSYAVRRALLANFSQRA